MKKTADVKIKTVIFDIGNVLINFDHRIALKKLARFSPLTVNEMLAVLARSKTKITYEKGLISDAVFCSKIMHQLKLSMDRRTFEPIWCDIFRRNRQMEAVVKKVKRQGLRTAILSDTSAIHDRYELIKFNVLKESGRFFRSYKLKAVKAEGPGIFRTVLKKLKAKPGETIFIDDIKRNVRFAKQCGIRAVEFKNIAGLRRDLAKYGIVI